MFNNPGGGETRLRVHFPTGPREYVLPKTPGAQFIVGRGNNATLRFENTPDFAYISNRHCHIIFENDKYYVADGLPGSKPSTAGTYINGKRNTGSYVQLHNGDRISLGNYDRSLMLDFVAPQSQINEGFAGEMETGAQMALNVTDEVDENAPTESVAPSGQPPSSPFDDPISSPFDDIGSPFDDDPFSSPPSTQQRAAPVEDPFARPSTDPYAAEVPSNPFPPAYSSAQPPAYSPPPQQNQPPSSPSRPSYQGQQPGYGQQPASNPYGYNQPQQNQPNYGYGAAAQNPSNPSAGYGQPGYPQQGYGQQQPYPQQQPYGTPAYGQPGYTAGYAPASGGTLAGSLVRIIMTVVIASVGWSVAFAGWSLYLFDNFGSENFLDVFRIVTVAAIAGGTFLTGIALTWFQPTSNKLTPFLWTILAAGVAAIGVYVVDEAYQFFTMEMLFDSDALNDGAGVGTTIWGFRIGFALLAALMLSSLNVITRGGAEERRFPIFMIPVAFLAWIGMTFLVTVIAPEIVDVLTSDVPESESEERLNTIIGAVTFGVSYAVLVMGTLAVLLNFLGRPRGSQQPPTYYQPQQSYGGYGNTYNR